MSKLTTSRFMPKQWKRNLRRQDAENRYAFMRRGRPARPLRDSTGDTKGITTMCENPLGTPGSWALCTRAKAAEKENARLRAKVADLEATAQAAEDMRDKSDEENLRLRAALQAPIEDLKNMNRPDELERSRFVKEIHAASQRVDEFPDWLKTMRDRSVAASEYTKGIETMGAEFDEGFAIGINENQNHDHATELLALRKAAKAADQARKPRGEPLEVLSDPPEFRPPTVLKFSAAHTEDERRQVMAILERLAAAEKEIEELRQRLLAAEEDARALREVAYIANGIVGAGLLDGRRVKDDLTTALAKTEQPGFLFEK